MNFLPPFNLCCVTDAHLLEIFDRYSTDSACGILDGLPSFSDGWSTVCHAVRVPRSVFSGQEDPLVPDDSPLVIDLSFIPVDNVFFGPPSVGHVASYFEVGVPAHWAVCSS